MVSGNTWSICPDVGSKVLHPLAGESLTPGAVATVTWATSAGWDGSGGDTATAVAAEGVDELWLVDEAAGDDRSGELIGSGIGADCRVCGCGSGVCIDT